MRGVGNALKVIANVTAFMKAISNPNLFSGLIAENLEARRTQNEAGTQKQLSGHNRLHSSNCRIGNAPPVSSQEGWTELHSWLAGSILQLHLTI